MTDFDPDRMFSIDIQDIQAAMRENQRMLAAIQPAGSYGRALQYVIIDLHRYAAAITHVLTGALRAAHRMSIDVEAGRAEIYIDPGAIGPNGRPYTYGMYEHAHGGEHAFYDRTIAEEGMAALDKAERIIWQGVGI